jgi:flagellar motor switch protein FliN/FliY
MSSSKNSSFSSDAAMPFGKALQEVLCRVEVVLGTTSLSMRQCLALQRDAVVRLEQASGTELQVLVNGIPIALGEVAIIDDSAAIRVTDILPPAASTS